MTARVVVYPPMESGGRRVRLDGEAIGLAHSQLDLREFLRRAGLDDAEGVQLDDPELFEWRGGGPAVWL